MCASNTEEVSVDDGNVNCFWDAERVGAGCVSFQGSSSVTGSKPASLDGTGTYQCQEMLTSKSLSLLLAHLIHRARCTE